LSGRASRWREDEECRLLRGVIPGSSGNRFAYQQEKCVNKFSIRLLVLAVFATTAAMAPMVTAANAAATAVKKKHKRVNHAGSEAQAPRTSSQQYPANMADDPNRRVSY
jgi:hypothetical protein